MSCDMQLFRCSASVSDNLANSFGGSSHTFGVFPWNDGCFGVWERACTGPMRPFKASQRFCIKSSANRVGPIQRHENLIRFLMLEQQSFFSCKTNNFSRVIPIADTRELFSLSMKQIGKFIATSLASLIDGMSWQLGAHHHHGVEFGSSMRSTIGNVRARDLFRFTSHCAKPDAVLDHLEQKIQSESRSLTASSQINGRPVFE
jgi:hypothetical protein